MAAVHKMFEDIYAAVKDGLVPALADAGLLIEALSPVVEDIADQKQLRITMDAVQAALFLALPPIFHSGGSSISIPRQTHIADMQYKAFRGSSG